MKALLPMSIAAVVTMAWIGSGSALKGLPPGEMEGERKIWDALLATPISFYGKVVDENGEPIPDAEVKLSFADSLEEKNTKDNKVTDASGRFYASGHGLGLVVQTSKKGYYRTEHSDGGFAYAERAGKIDAHPDPAKPAVFVLRKQGQLASGVSLERRTFRIPKDGTPVEINLTTGEVAAKGMGDFMVEAWMHDEGHALNSNDPYDWRCRLTVPGGGLTERKERLDLRAPASGYLASDEISMPASAASQWRNRVERQYFLQLKNGTYALIRLRIAAEGNPTVYIDSFLNPQVGSRNVESQQIERWSSNSR